MLECIHTHAWLNLWDKHMTTGRINQVFTLPKRFNHETTESIWHRWADVRTRLAENFCFPRTISSTKHLFDDQRSVYSDLSLRSDWQNPEAPHPSRSPNLDWMKTTEPSELYTEMVVVPHNTLFYETQFLYLLCANDCKAINFHTQYYLERNAGECTNI